MLIFEESRPGRRATAQAPLERSDLADIPAAFRRGRLRIMLDETEAGCFLEFEGERSDIIRYARVLGFSSRDLIKKDYVQILKAQEKKV